MNLVLRNKDDLRATNYILHPAPDNNFWANISGNRIHHYVATCGDAFNIVLVGSSDDEADFYAIPYSVIKPALTEAYRTLDKTGRLRWVARVRNHQLHLGRYPVTVDVSAYYGNHFILNITDRPSLSTSDENDYAIENRRSEIQQRLKQSVFRKRVSSNFGGTCCLSGVAEESLLIASHIIPWSKRINTRLDPANGLYLFVSYDRLFDHGFISFDDNLCVLVTPIADQLSFPLQQILTQLDGQCARPPIKWQIKSEYLEYHRQNVFQWQLVDLTKATQHT
ncbi:MAG: HNH endonuclease [Chloroflexota bacterium]